MSAITKFSRTDDAIVTCIMCFLALLAVIGVGFGSGKLTCDADYPVLPGVKADYACFYDGDGRLARLKALPR